MGKTSIPGKRRIRELYDLRGILNAVWNRLRFTVTGSGAEHLTINQTGGVVTVDFDTEGLGGGVPEDIAIEDVDGLGDALAGKAATSHSHATSDVTGLDSALAGKAATSHSHATSDVTGLDSALAGKAATSHSHATSDVTGLDSALAGKAATSHSHATSDVTGLDSALAGKAATSHSHATSDVTGLDAALAGKASTSHSHATSDVTGLDAALAGKAAASHTHATSEVTGLDAALAGKAAASHDHNASAINAGTIDAARLPVAGTTTIGGVKRNTGSAGQYLLGFDSDGAALYSTPVSGYRPGRNYLINGDFLIAQNPNTTPTDGSYALDRWYALRGNTTGTLSYERYSALALGDPERAAVLRMQLSTADYKYGVAQIVESINCADLINQQVTLSFWAKGNGNTTAKAGIVSWSGPADTVTRDIVSSWGSDLTTPTLIANATFENTPAAIALTSTWSHHEVTATIDTPGATNVIVFLWIDDSTNNQLYLDRVQLEIGAAATPFERIPIADQLARCQRYYEVARYNEDNIGAHSSFYYGTTYNHHWYYKATKRIKPVVTLATGSWTGGAPTINEGIDSTYLTRVGAFFASGTSGNVCLAADAEL